MRGARSTLTGQWVKFGAQLGATVVLARLLNSTDYGVYALVLTVTALASLFVDLGFSSASVQAEQLTQQQRTNVFWINLGFGVGAAAVIAAASPLVAAFYHQEILNLLLPVTALSLILQAAVSQFAAEASRTFRFTLLAVSDVSGQVLGAVLGIGAALAGFGVWSLIVQQLAGTLITCAVVIQRVAWRPGLPHRAPMRALLGFGVNTFGIQLLNYFSSNADSVVLGRTAGTEALGIYNRAYQLFRLPVQQLLSPLTRVALPTLSRLQNDPLRFDSAVRRLQLAALYTSGTVFFLAAALARPGIALFLGNGWADSARIFAILAVGGFFQVMGYVYYWVFLALALTRLQLRYTVITRILMVALILLGSGWGATGVAFGVSLGLATNWLVLTLFAIPKTGVDTRRLVGTTVRPLVCHTAICGTVLLLDQVVALHWLPVLQLAIFVPLAMIGYAIAALIPGVRKDYGMLRQFVGAMR